MRVCGRTVALGRQRVTFAEKSSPEQPQRSIAPSRTGKHDAFRWKRIMIAVFFQLAHIPIVQTRPSKRTVRYCTLNL